MQSIPRALVAGLTLVMAAAPVSAGAVDDDPTRVPLPFNVSMGEAEREMVERAVALSATLRRQLAVIAAAAARVEIRVSGVRMPGSRRAETTISRYEAGFIRAQVVIAPGRDFVELLAHELEHIVEQVDGVDLAALARTSHATRDSAGVYETVRARDAGRAAASEVEEALRELN